MEYIIPAMHSIASLESLAVIVVGVLLGTLMGAMPGLGPTMAVTLVLPFTFLLGQVPAILLLLALYCSATYGGAISAILINTPGTAASAATCLDGFAMTKRGEADLALGWATVSSVIGGIISCIALLFAAPQLARLALNFGPIETFALITLALTCIAAVSGGSMLKGLIAGAAGIFVSTVGPDPVTGDLRYDFGVFDLSAGLALLPVIIGMFALAEVFDRAVSSAPAIPDAIVRVGIRIPGWSSWKPRVPLLFKASMIGTFIGALPGSGSAIASFISYAEAGRSSPRRAGLGKGEPDGIVASETANNAVTGGALVPTLALGIPGDPVTAVMMSTFLMHGVPVGVRLFADSPVLIYSFFEGLLIINLLLLPAGLICALVLSRVLRVPEPLLMAGVTILALVGALTARNNSFDLFVALGAGVMGFMMRRTGFPVAPLVIGFVLGPQTETYLRTSLLLTDGSFLAFAKQPIALGLFGLTAFFIAIPILRAYFDHRKRDMRKSW